MAADGVGGHAAREDVAEQLGAGAPVRGGAQVDGGDGRFGAPGRGAVDAGGDAFPLVTVDEARFGLPTCWDQWFPEPARAYSLAGADVLVYPTAIGSEPGFPGFDSQPLWQKVITGNAIANATFMIVPNRVGAERGLAFYGSSFVVDPYGRVLAQAPRDEPAALVADLDLDARRDWLELFPFLTTRRPDAYGPLTETARFTG